MSMRNFLYGDGRKLYPVLMVPTKTSHRSFPHTLFPGVLSWGSDNRCCDFPLPSCWWPLSFVCEIPWVSVALKWWCYLASLLGPLLSPHPFPLGLFTHSVGYHLQTNNSQIPISNPALAPNTAIGRSTGPSAWFSEATQNQQTHKLLNLRSLHSAQPVFALLKGTIHDPVAKRQGRLILILPPLSVPAGSWPAVFISSCPWTSLRSVCPSPSLPA